MSKLFQSVLLGSVILPALLILAGGVLGLGASSFAQYLATQIVIACLVGVALVMIVGYARVIMLATGAMMAIGAYGSAMLMLHLGVPYLLTLPVCVLFGLVAGFVLAVPSTRFKGHHLAMATIVFQFLVVIGIREAGDWTGGALGLRVPTVDVFGISANEDGAWMFVVAIACALAIGSLGVLLGARFGKTLKAISDAEVAADAYGVDLVRFKIAAFAISSAYLALAGALLAPGVRVLDPESFGIHLSIVTLGYPIVGGMGSLWGGIIGGGVLRTLPEALRFLGQYQELWVALLAIAVMMINPGGILGIARSLLPASRGQVKDVVSAPVHDVRPVAASAPASAEDAIRVVAGVKAYDGLIAVDHVDLVVKAGEIHGLIGPNGAGKTTLFNAISGFTPFDSGAIALFGRQVENEPSRRRISHSVTRTFQHVAVFGQLSCLDNVIIGLGRNGVADALAASVGEVAGSAGTRDAARKALDALREVGLEELAHEPARRLSLGNQRRLEIARAIVSRPRLILLDEPVSGVAEEEEHRIAELLAHLNRQHGITMLLIEHNIAFVRRLAHSMSVMAAGRIIASGEPEQTIARPEVRQQYFGEAHVEYSA
ncbi:MAG TPA: branched-chain amino acid ABC transporter ATP-binding protein/permease [Rhizobiaceae bacterium]|nr:branched-chain amino acid ABC transporter ATP-binding protein/permease [Rhizobiaceae bacterium]